MTTSREEFEAWFSSAQMDDRLMYGAWRGWTARDAEVAALTARVAELEGALRCDNSPYEQRLHRCIYCDDEVMR